ncbi:Fic family protein [Aquiflexum sp.]
MTQPDSPKSQTQKYRLTTKSKSLKDFLNKNK